MAWASIMHTRWCTRLLSACSTVTVSAPIRPKPGNAFSGGRPIMKLYVLSFGAGLLVGIIYNLLNVRSPAPPLVALVGLLGILLGEQLIPVGKQLLNGAAFKTACTSCQA